MGPRLLPGPCRPTLSSLGLPLPALLLLLYPPLALAAIPPARPPASSHPCRASCSYRFTNTYEYWPTYAFRSAGLRSFRSSSFGFKRQMTSPVWSRLLSFLLSRVVPLMSVPFPEVSSAKTSISSPFPPVQPPPPLRSPADEEFRRQ